MPPAQHGPASGNTSACEPPTGEISGRGPVTKPVVRDDAVLKFMRTLAVVIEKSTMPSHYITGRVDENGTQFEEVAKWDSSSLAIWTEDNKRLLANIDKNTVSPGFFDQASQKPVTDITQFIKKIRDVEMLNTNTGRLNFTLNITTNTKFSTIETLYAKKSTKRRDIINTMNLAKVRHVAFPNHMSQQVSNIRWNYAADEAMITFTSVQIGPH